MWTPVWLDALLGYGTPTCEGCGRRFSARPEWLESQVTPTGPWSGRLTHCRRCPRDVNGR